MTSKQESIDEVAFGIPTAELITQAANVRETLKLSLAVEDTKTTALRKSVSDLVSAYVDATLALRSVRDLSKVTNGQVRVGLVESAGYRTVLDISNAGYRDLGRIDGVGPHTARQLMGAARQFQQKIEENYRLRLDAETKPASHTAVVRALIALDRVETLLSPLEARIKSLDNALSTMAHAAEPATRGGLKMFFTSSNKRQEFRVAVDALASKLSSPTTEKLLSEVASALSAVDKAETLTQPWTIYSSDAARLNGILAKVVGNAPADDLVQGGLPSAVAEKVNRFRLNTSRLKANLRGYQEFGAKYALTQERTIIGDEMGLGKTVEALAVAAHLAAEGATHFLVVAPASVMVNWIHETSRHTDLPTIRVHGPEKAAAIRRWKRHGGVAITTYATLRNMDHSLAPKIALLIADEAHHVKNPKAQQTKVLLKWLSQSQHVLFLTGTPIENRVEEFKALIHHLNQDLAASIETTDAFMDGTWFKERVAPVYLRRNQADVLNELPDLIESENWVEFTSVDFAHYRDSVLSKNFMTMRRAAYMADNALDSAKIERLLEIVNESIDDGQKVAIFSYFHDTLDAIGRALQKNVAGDVVAGVITGKVSPDKRQGIIDAFTKQAAPGVLLLQIQAGGEGLNIQAASVALITEPQWKPSTEEQAIRRLQRMGQTRRVSVHRLLATDSVDERMVEVLANKKNVFDEYARQSSVKDATTMAVDISDVSKAIKLSEAAIIEAEATRLAEMEKQKRKSAPPTVDEEDGSEIGF